MNTAKSIKFFKLLRCVLYGAATVFLMISLIALIKSVIYDGFRDMNLNALARNIVEIIGVLVAIIGVNMLYDKFKEKQDEAIFGFYIHMQTYLASLKLFLGPLKRLPNIEADFDYKEATVFTELLGKEFKSKSGIASNKSAIDEFNKFSEQFYKFLLETKDNIPPTSDIKGWYNNMEILSDFLSFGMVCGKEFYKKLSESCCQKYHSKVVKSIIYISKEINCKINTFHSERN